MSDDNIEFKDLIAYENRNIEEKTCFPSKSWFNTFSYENLDKKRIRNTIDDAGEDTVIGVTHNDADGLVAGALMKDFYDDIEVVVTDYEFLEYTFGQLVEKRDHISKLIVADLNLDKYIPILDDVADITDEFIWLDHHEWGSEQQKLEDNGVDVTINRDKCAARIVFDFVKDQGYSYDSNVQDIVDLTEDHDLWIKESTEIEIGGDELVMSDILSTVAFFSDNEDFMNNIFDYGMDFRSYQDDLLASWVDNRETFVEEKAREDRQKKDYVMNNLVDERNISEIGGYRVGKAYGRVQPTAIMERMDDKYGVDIFVLFKPSGKISIRSGSDFEECHKIAEEMGGGGHEKAAAAPPPDWGLCEYSIHFNQKPHTALEREVMDAVEKIVT